MKSIANHLTSFVQEVAVIEKCRYLYFVWENALLSFSNNCCAGRRAGGRAKAKGLSSAFASLVDMFEADAEYLRVRIVVCSRSSRKV